MDAVTFAASGRHLDEQASHKRDRILGHYARVHRRRLRKRLPAYALLLWVGR